ncbi:GntR family transcriptional regulator [Sphingomonas sp. Leaf412]|uniref:UTRA domain-containing protein n=1 Tax=Sphingomonas sp. Leaf412 TaxID=1736370 RepID=UPI0007023050|nr:UTRA domain-containing protein [Sphingomonas sp. Leaf412]KQT32110.1 GntR family transcriptional regulator [Sphingomonas sp. Leaf412]
MSDTPIPIPPLDGDGPIWLQIRRSMALAILTGDWPAGTRVPAETSLTDIYAASRMTVNKAIQSLASEGLVERRPRTGTIVTARARERPVLEIWDAADAVRRDGRRYGYRLLSCDMLAPGAPARGDLPAPADAAMMRMLCLHSSDDRPFQLEERLVNVAAAPRIVRQPLETVSPGAWLLANVPWTQARHRISARGATAAVAGHLALAEGEACLVVERRTWNADVPVTMGRFWYPGDDHALEGQFRPSW